MNDSSKQGDSEYSRALALHTELKEAGDVEALIRELENPAEKQFARFGEWPEEPVITARGSAIRALADLGDKRATLAIARLLKDPRVSVRANAAKALARLADERAAPALLEALPKSASGETRWIAIALGRTRDPASVPALVEVLSRPEWQLRATAAESLAEIGDAQAIDPVRETLAKEPRSNWRARRRLKKSLRSLLRRAEREGSSSATGS